MTERPSPHRTTRKCEMKVSRTRPSALRLTTRGSSGFERVVVDPVDHQALARLPARQCREARAALARTLGDADQQDHLAPRDDRPGIEDPDDLEIVAQGLQIGRTQEQSLKMPLQEHRQAPSSFARSSLGQPIGGAGDGQRVPAVVLGDLPLVRMVMNPGDLVGHDGPEQLAITM